MISTRAFFYWLHTATLQHTLQKGTLRQVLPRGLVELVGLPRVVVLDEALNGSESRVSG